MAEKQSQELKDFLKFQENLKKTSLGLSFGKKLFTNPGGLTGMQITETLRALGLNIPKEVETAREIAQLIVTGQTIYDAYEKGQTLLQVANPSVGMVAQAYNILSDNGIVQDDAYGSAGTTLALAGNVCALVASFGTDVNAWLSLGMMAYGQAQQNQALAAMGARRGLIENVQNYLRPQQLAFTNNIEQLKKGQIGALGFLAKNAAEAPSTFVTMIQKNPDMLKVLSTLVPNIGLIQGMPTYSGHFWYESTYSDSFLGMGRFNEKSDKATMNIDMLRLAVDGSDPASRAKAAELIRMGTQFGYSGEAAGDFGFVPPVSQVYKFLETPEAARTYFFNLLIYPNLVAYEAAYAHYKTQLFSLESLAMAYAMGAPIDTIEPGKDYSWIFEYCDLTPHEFGDDRLVNVWLDEYTTPRPSYTAEWGIDYGGGLKAAISKKEIGPDEIEQNKRILMYADLYGYARPLYHLKGVREHMGLYCNFPRFNGENTAFRKIQNFIVALQYLELIQSDPYYFNWETEKMKRFSFYPKIEDFARRTEALSSIATARKINRLGRANVAFFLNTTPENLVKVSPDTVMGPGYFTAKG